MNKVYVIYSDKANYYDENSGQFRGFLWSTYYDTFELAEQAINNIADKSYTFLEIKAIYIQIK